MVANFVFMEHCGAPRLLERVPQLLTRSPHASMLAALEEGPQFHRLGQDGKKSIRIVLARALWSMWGKRNAILALAEPQENFPSGVEANVGRT